jgi:hypothetical protein
MAARPLERPGVLLLRRLAPGGPRGVAAAMFGHTGLGMLICRKECITYANTYALNGILARDSRDVAMLLQRLSTL